MSAVVLGAGAGACSAQEPRRPAATRSWRLGVEGDEALMHRRNATRSLGGTTLCRGSGVIF